MIALLVRCLVRGERIRLEPYPIRDNHLIAYSCSKHQYVRARPFDQTDRI